MSTKVETPKRHPIPERRNGKRAAELANRCRIGRDNYFSTIDENESTSGRPVSYYVALGAELGDMDETELKSVLIPFLPMLRKIVAEQDAEIDGCNPGDVVSMETVTGRPDAPNSAEAFLAKLEVRA